MKEWKGKGIFKKCYFIHSFVATGTEMAKDTDMKTHIGMEVTGGALVIGKHVMMIKIMTMAMVMIVMAMMMMVITQMWAGIVYLGGRVGLRHWQLQRERVQVVVCHQNHHCLSSKSSLYSIMAIIAQN